MNVLNQIYISIVTKNITFLTQLSFEFKNNQEISYELNIQDNTIQKHIQNIFRKMRVSSKWDLLKFRP